jgi:hypothetical protein
MNGSGFVMNVVASVEVAKSCYRFSGMTNRRYVNSVRIAGNAMQVLNRSRPYMKEKF